MLPGNTLPAPRRSNRTARAIARAAITAAASRKLSIAPAMNPCPQNPRYPTTRRLGPRAGDCEPETMFEKPQLRHHLPQRSMQTKVLSLLPPKTIGV